MVSTEGLPTGDEHEFATREEPGDAVPRPATIPVVRAKPPLAKRLNRNALTAAAVVVGLTALAVVTLVDPTKPSAASAGTGATSEAAPSPARPSFLDLPPKAPPQMATTDSAPSHVEPALVPPVTGMLDSAAAMSIRSNPATVTAATPQSIRWQAYQSALMSGLVIAGSREPQSPSAAAPITPEASPTNVGLPITANLVSGSPVPGFASTQPVVPPVPTVTPTAPDSGLTRSTTTAPTPVDRSSTAVAVAIEPAGTPYTLRAGTVIEGLLLTGVNSDLPGEVSGQVSRDVYDSETERILLIPHGTRVIGTYSNREASTGRLMVTWRRLILPDGRSFTLPGSAAKDETGATGLHDEVDHHYGRIYGQAALVSAIGAAAQLSQPQPSSVYEPLTARQVAAGAVGQEFSDVALEQARSGMDVRPTLLIRQGEPFNVFLSSDVVFDTPYSSPQ